MKKWKARSGRKKRNGPLRYRYKMLLSSGILGKDVFKSLVVMEI